MSGLRFLQLYNIHRAERADRSIHQGAHGEVTVPQTGKNVNLLIITLLYIHIHIYIYICVCAYLACQLCSLAQCKFFSPFFIFKKKELYK